MVPHYSLRQAFPAQPAMTDHSRVTSSLSPLELSVIEAQRGSIEQQERRSEQATKATASSTGKTAFMKSASSTSSSSPRLPKERGAGRRRSVLAERQPILRPRSQVLTGCLDGFLESLDATGRKKGSLWYSVKAFSTVAAVVLVMVIALQGLGNNKPVLPSNNGPAVGASSPVRPDRVIIADTFPVASVRGALASSTPAAASVVRQLRSGPKSTRESAIMPARSLGDDNNQINQIDDNNQMVSAETSPPRARVAYLIMTSGIEELHKTKRLLKTIYDPSNFYLVHMDRKNDPAMRRDLETFIEGWENVRMLTPALDVSWGGYTITLTAIFGICTLVQWSDEWDYFVNLSASDFPLLPQSELTEVLGRYKDVGMNFVSGAPLNERNRVEVLIDDQGLYREKQSSKAGRPLKVGKPRLPPSKSMFTVYKGEFWVILHRSVCKYIEASPDNVARSLQAYFSRFRISDESYFQTVLCHPLAPNFPVHSDNLRFVSWPSVSEGHYVLHPDPITNGNVGEAMQSGALFARKFDLEVSQEAYAVLGESLRESKPDRLERAVLRLDPASNVDGRQRFCAIPEGYSIQEVLSHPPKKAMAMQRERNPAGAAVSMSSPIVPDAARQPDTQASQARETLEGKSGSP